MVSEHDESEKNDELTCGLVELCRMQKDICRCQTFRIGKNDSPWKVFRSLPVAAARCQTTESSDKVSKLLGLGYPGGPVIDTLARDGNPEAIDFPRAYLPESLDFSFSGLKTAVLNFVKSEISFPNYPSPLGGAGRGEGTSLALINDISASFQAAVVDVLVRKTEWAIKKERIRCVTLSGGVAANSALRRRMQEMADEREVELFMPSLSLCTDNAAMIAAAGYHHFRAGNRAGLDLNPVAYLPL